jgi:hypothetical protein
MPRYVAKTLVFICLLFCVESPYGWTQHQRYGISPQTFILNGKGKTRVAEAYCLDRHLFASNSFVPYPRVINEGSDATVRMGNAAPISMQAALTARQTQRECLRQRRVGVGADTIKKVLTRTMASRLSRPRNERHGGSPL